MSALESELESAAGELEGMMAPPPPPGAYQSTSQLARGNLGERLATEALASQGHRILMYKPDISGTNQPGIDLVTMHDGRLWLIDNKARSRGGNIYGVSALTRNLGRNIGTVRTQLDAMARDSGRTAEERRVAREALRLLGARRYVKAVTNANIARLANVPSGVHPRLQRQGIRFIDVFRSAGVPPPLARRAPGRRGRTAGAAREFEWRAEYELEAAAEALEQNQGEGFFTRMQPTTYGPGSEEGHEVLTRHAAAGVLSGPEVAWLVEGVVTPDRGGPGHAGVPQAIRESLTSPAAQPPHALRATAATGQWTALAAIQNHLATLYRNALAAPSRADQLRWVGQSLHLIQDSYSGAHVERALTAPTGPNRIHRIRAFYLEAWPPARSTAPTEHGLPADPRDSIWLSPGVFRNESLFAIHASREFLLMVLAHLAAPWNPANAGQFSSFLSRHFSF